MMKNKVLIIVCGTLIVCASEAFADYCTTHENNGVKTDMTCAWPNGKITTTYYDPQGREIQYIGLNKDGSLEEQQDYTYDEDGTMTRLIYNSSEAVENHTPDAKSVSHYDTKGLEISYQYWNSPQSVANDTPDYKEERSYDSNGYMNLYTEWDSQEAIANNTPTNKSSYTYDAEGNETSYTSWSSQEAIANDTPDYKETYQYNADQGVFMKEYYNNSESIAQNAPDLRTFEMQNEQGEYQYLAYNKDGNIAGINGDDRFIYDAQGRVTAIGTTFCK